MEGLLVLILFGVFALCVLSVLLTGAGAYKRLMERGQNAFEERTVPQYIATRVRQADVAGGISVGSLEGIPTLELREEIGGKQYITRIYCYDGQLYELFSENTVQVIPSDGEPITRTAGVDFLLENNRLTVVLEGEEGVRTEFALTLRAGGGDK